MELITQPWPWYVAGPLIAMVMFALLYFGESFGISSNLRTLCAISGADKHVAFFRIKKDQHIWNLIFVIGALLGGYLAHHYLVTESPLVLSEKTSLSLEQLGFQTPGTEYLPSEIFGLARLKSFSGWAILLIGGVLVGFGARYAGGCTSGHAISGLSNLQLPSLIAVVGFFIGGLLMVHLIMPLLFAVIN